MTQAKRTLIEELRFAIRDKSVYEEVGRVAVKKDLGASVVPSITGTDALLKVTGRRGCPP